MSKTKILFTIGGLSPEFGGPSQSVPALAVALAHTAVEVEIITCEPPPGYGLPLLPPLDLVQTRLLPYACRSTRWLPWTNAFTGTLREACAASTNCIIHDHGLWLPTNHAAACAARKSGCPFIVSPRGMLTAWALRHKSLKKRLAWMLFQRRDVEHARVLHATSAEEARTFRNAGLRRPIAVIPNGVQLPPWQEHVEGNPKRRTVLFLGRIHPVKGLLDLVQAWARIRNDGWGVVIAGGDDGGHRAEVEAAIRTEGLDRDFSFVGKVDGDAKWGLYQQADLFVLPSHSENFGIVAAEALACGVPVIATRGTPWEDLATHRCGWWIKIGSEPLAAALAEATALPDDARREMGRRGRQLMETKYTWPRVAAQMRAVYGWMLGEEPKPDCIVE